MQENVFGARVFMRAAALVTDPHPTFHTFRQQTVMWFILLSVLHVVFRISVDILPSLRLQFMRSLSVIIFSKKQTKKHKETKRKQREALLGCDSNLQQSRWS